MQTTVSTSNTRLAPYLGFAALLHAVMLLVPLHHAPTPLLKELRLALAQPGAAPAAAEPATRALPQHRAPRLPAPAAGTAPSAAEPAPVAASPTLAAATPESGISPAPGSARVIARVHAALARYFVYPLAARRQGWQGEVLVAFLVTREGRIDNVEVVRSSGYQLLDEAARRSLAQVGTLPDYTSDEPLQIRMPVVYRLEG